MAIRTSRIILRLPEELDAWLDARAGGKRRKPEFVRQVLERMGAREENAELTALFDAAWDSLGADEREEIRRDREAWMNAYAGGSEI